MTKVKHIEAPETNEERPDNMPSDRVTLQIGDERWDLPLETVSKALLEAGWRIEPCHHYMAAAREHGYRLIGPAEVAVLAASAKAPESDLKLVVSMGGHPSWEREHAQAELARRGGGG